MEELKNFNNHDLFSFIHKKSDDEFLQWLQESKLLWKTKFCECGNEMSQYYSKRKNKETNEVIEDKWPIWRCNSRKS